MDQRFVAKVLLTMGIVILLIWSVRALMPIAPVAPVYDQSGEIVATIPSETYRRHRTTQIALGVGGIALVAAGVVGLVKSRKPTLPARIALAVTGMGALGLTIYFGGGFYSRSRNEAKAERHIEALTPLLNTDERFRAIDLRATCRVGGLLVVDGFVQDRSAFDDLKTLVDSTNPPVRIWWRVDVNPGVFE